MTADPRRTARELLLKQHGELLANAQKRPALYGTGDRASMMLSYLTGYVRSVVERNASDAEAAQVLRGVSDALTEITRRKTREEDR
jgi:hypothetical protein